MHRLGRDTLAAPFVLFAEASGGLDGLADMSGLVMSLDLFGWLFGGSCDVSFCIRDRIRFDSFALAERLRRPTSSGLFVEALGYPGFGLTWG